jgi:hypothetical protein
MSGGIGHVLLDGIEDYRSLRIKRFGLFRAIALTLRARFLVRLAITAP